jgi:hypothetical protein
MAAILAGMAVVGGWRVALEGRPFHGITPAMGGLAAAVLAFALSHAASRARRLPHPPPIPHPLPQP